VTARTVRASRAGLLNGSVVSEDLDGDPEVACGVEVRHPAATELAAEHHGVVALGLGDGLVEVVAPTTYGAGGKATRSIAPGPVRPVDHVQADLLGETVGILGRGLR
jgi:hypothetical protein